MRVRLNVIGPGATQVTGAMAKEATKLVQAMPAVQVKDVPAIDVVPRETAGTAEGQNWFEAEIALSPKGMLCIEVVVVNINGMAPATTGRSM